MTDWRVEPETIRQFADRDIFKRLLKLSENGATLPTEAKGRLELLFQEHPRWVRHTTDEDHFLIYMTTSNGPYVEHEVTINHDYLKLTTDQEIEDLIANQASETNRRWRGSLDKKLEQSIPILTRFGEQNRISFPRRPGDWP